LAQKYQTIDRSPEASRGFDLATATHHVTESPMMEKTS
jgi:hypothetical protein